MTPTWQRRLFHWASVLVAGLAEWTRSPCAHVLYVGVSLITLDMYSSGYSAISLRTTFDAWLLLHHGWLVIRAAFWYSCWCLGPRLLLDSDPRGDGGASDSQLVDTLYQLRL